MTKPDISLKTKAGSVVSQVNSKLLSLGAAVGAVERRSGASDCLQSNL